LRLPLGFPTVAFHGCKLPLFGNNARHGFPGFPVN
jgi:hypothetical protein